MKISAIAFLVAIGLSGCVSDNHGLDMASLSTDCASEGRQKPLAYDNGAGTSWQRTNTSRWCDPRGGIAPSGDPTFEGTK